ncbi:kinase-like domain-containing protein [Rhizophagus clarus]|uniref:Kinase-like domain-containing protein n=1 Tax=Rhizophagus clarus TaxID=94130 RepID=A0A8H3QK50_9GLOM|nr:kinase-like domain-containing protein [Rhizophagus clarus]
MKECWNSDPSKRPTINLIVEIAFDWYTNKFSNQFKLAESKRLELIQSKDLILSLAKSRAIFTSRWLASLISTTNLSSINMNRGTAHKCIIRKFKS